MANWQNNISAFIDEIQSEIENAAAITVSTYAKIGMKEVVEDWINNCLIAEIKAGTLVDDIADNTKERRLSRGNPDAPALYEEGKLLSYVEVSWTCLPDKTYDLVEVGIFNDSEQIGHDFGYPVTPVALATINEYGLSGAFTNQDGVTTVVDIPARPFLTRAAEKAGFDRVMTDVDAKVNVAAGRTMSSMKTKGLQSTALGSATIKNQRRFESRWGGSKPPGMTTQVQKGHVHNDLVFRWDDHNVENEYEAAIARLSSS